MDASAELCDRLAAAGVPALTINIGGGFPVSYAESDEYPALSVFAEALKPLNDSQEAATRLKRILLDTHDVG